MNILAIETSCDETAAAIVCDGIKEIASVVSSSSELHKQTGGVVPEVAARKQVEYMVPVLDSLISQAGEFWSLSEREDIIKKIDALAITVGPGLIGSLLVGVSAAKVLALAWNKPLISVNHLVGHIYANFIDQNDPIQFPSVALVVSGGHTDLVLMKDHNDFEYLGGTLDDAAGEAFDKTARLLGISEYLGGPQLSKKASECKKNVVEGKLPRPKINDDDFDFSFSGLKSAVRRLVLEDKYPVDSVACEFENAVVDVLVKKTLAAVEKHSVKSLLIGGGVAANKQLRTRLQSDTPSSTTVHIPPTRLCGDNAIYIASAAYFQDRDYSMADIVADPSLTIMDSFSK